MSDADRAGQDSAVSSEPSREADVPVDVSQILSYKNIGDEIFSSIPGERADHARAFQEAAQNLESRSRAATSGASSTVGQVEALAAWAGKEGRLIPASEIDRHTLVSNSTSEHEVFYRETDGRAVKRTWPGFYGQIPVPENGKLGRQNASPSEF